MRFGRFHGLALIVLGLILLATQAWLITRPRAASSAGSQGAVARPETGPNPLPARLPAVLGTVSLIVGFALIVWHRDQHKGD